MDRQNQTRDTDKPGPITRADLFSYFTQACRPAESWKIGAEFETLAVFRETGHQVPYFGPHGVQQILLALSDRFAWSPVYEEGHIIGLARAGATITIEPGGQIELSSAIRQSIHELDQDVQVHLSEIAAVVDLEKVAWVAIGLTPYSQVEEVPLVPKSRYEIMDEYLPARGAFARHMMRGTASTQAAFDYESEEDAVRKFVIALSLSPLVNALFSNSPVYSGRLTGDVSHRGRIWTGMYPDRSGYLTEVVRERDFSFERWIEYMLDLPMMFYCKDHTYTPAHGRPFRDYMVSGFEGHFPGPDEWEMHLTSTFPEVRLKRYLEVRGADCVPAPLNLAVPAIWKGIFYDPSTLDDALELAREIRPEDREVAHEAAYRWGLQGAFLGRTVGAWSREILELACSGLKRQAAGNRRCESGYLDAAFEVVERGAAPGKVLANRWEEVMADASRAVDLMAF